MPTSKQCVLFAPLGVECCLGGAAVIERWQGNESEPRRYLHLPDEHERQARLLSNAAPDSERRLHRLRLDALEEARKRLAAVPAFAQVLTSADPLLWPPADVLLLAVDTECLAHTDPAARRALLQALTEVRREWALPGLYPLAPALSPGSLHVFRRGEEEALHRCPDASGPALGPSWSVAVPESAPTPLYMLLGSLRVPGPVAARVCAAAALASPRSFHDLVGLHHAAVRDGRPGLLLDVQETLGLLGLRDERVLAAHLSAAAAAQPTRRVRLAPGVFATVLQRRRAVVVLQRAVGESLSAGQRRHAEEFLGLSLVDAERAGELIRAVREESVDTIEAAARRHFLSPTHAADAPVSLHGRAGGEGVACTVRVVEGLPDGPGLAVALLESAANPIIVVHGPRVGGGMQGDAAALGELRRRRAESSAEVTLGPELRRARTEPAAPPGAAGAAQALPLPTGADLDEAVQRAAAAVLARWGPATRREMEARDELATLREAPGFTAALLRYLKENTEYRQRKYHPKF